MENVNWCYVYVQDPVTSLPQLVPTAIPASAPEMKVNWATSPGNQPKQDTSKHFHIFVGDLSPEIETQQLRDAFAPFGQISDCKIIRDPQTLKSKGYGFVSYVEKKDAETAIAGMNGQWIGTRPIRTNWATRKPPAPASKDSTIKPLDYDEVFSQTSSSNCTVYVGGLGTEFTEELLQKTFGVYGSVQEIRVFKDKGYAFVRFSNKESACNAIVTVHGTEIKGQIVKCSWGKESSDNSKTAEAQTQLQNGAVAAYPYSQYGQLSGYAGWPAGYPQGYQAGYPMAGYQQQQGFTTAGYQYGLPSVQAGTATGWSGQVQLPPAGATSPQAPPQQILNGLNGQQQGMMGYPAVGQQGEYTILQ